MKSNYIFHHSCYDKEILRRQIIVLNDNQVDFKIINKDMKAQFRAPLSGYFEAELHISEQDFDKADKLLIT